MDLSVKKLESLQILKCAACNKITNGYCDKYSDVSNDYICETCKIATLKNDSKKCICGVCSKHFPNCASLRNHMTLHSIYTAHQCSYCPKYILAAHYSRRDGVDVICKECKEGSGAALIYFEFEADYLHAICGACGSRYDKKHIIEHLWGHVTVRPYVCGICQTDFFAYNKYENHFKKHYKIIQS